MWRRALFLVSCSSVLASCGGDDDKDPVTVVYGTLTVANSTMATDDGTWDLTGLTRCSRNADTGRVDVVANLATGPSLTIAIKNYSSTAKAYTCVQASDNATSATDVGGKFDECMVDVKALSKEGATTVNGYSMHRDTAATKPFAYAGACSIDVTEASPIKATISCADMVQTVLEGAARNPIDAGVNADIEGSLSCTFQ